MVAEVVLKAASAERPKLRYTAGGLAGPPALASPVRARRHAGRWTSQGLPARPVQRCTRRLSRLGEALKAFIIDG